MLSLHTDSHVVAKAVEFSEWNMRNLGVVIDTKT